MPLVLWSVKYSLGIEVIDGQHRQLVDLINRLHDSLKAGEARLAAAEAFGRMRDYAHFHFSTEERYMEEFGYSGLSEHRAEHGAFREKIAGFEEAFAKGNIAVSLEMMRFLLDWLFRHIQAVDRKYAPLFKEHGL